MTDAQVVDVARPHRRRWTRCDCSPAWSAPGSAQSFLTPLLNVAPTSAQGVLLSEVLDPDYLTQHHIAGLGDLPAHLATACDLPGATELARLINVFARKDVGRVVFDASLPPLNATSSRDHRAHPRAGTADALARWATSTCSRRCRWRRSSGAPCTPSSPRWPASWCFADPSRLGVFVVDEAHHVTSSPEGERELIDFIRDGRKHQAAVLLGSHDPEADFGSPTLRGLIPTRVLMRHRDHTLARRGLAWLDLDPTDETLVKLLTEDTSPVGADGVPWHRRGEALLRHPTGVGRIKVLEPSRPDRAAAARTSPPEQTRL